MSDHAVEPFSPTGPVIDWEAARDRIRAAEVALVEGEVFNLLKDREVLERRTRELAREPVIEDDASDTTEIVVFTMAHERYGIAASLVREVYPLKELTSIPGTPAFVLGIVSIRGRVLSLIDLKKFFALPEKGLSERNQIIVLSSPEMEFGVLADTMLGVRAMKESELQRDLSTLTGLHREYLLGVSSDGIVVLDARRILGDPDIVVRDSDAL